MVAGGYEDQIFWSEADWAWKTQHDITHPAFWSQSGDRWYYLTMFDRVPLPLDWPAYVSHAEASAYARWAGKSLPTEAQWHRAAYGSPGDSERPYPWGTRGSQPTARELRLSALGSCAGGRRSRRTERLRCCRPARQRLGMDFEFVRAFSGIRAVPLLSGLLGQLFRRKALRTERRLGAHRRLYVAPLFSQLVPAALPIRLFRISLREPLKLGPRSLPC